MRHIFNGDCACEAFRATGRNDGELLVWRENYLWGELPGPDTPTEEFLAVRARALARMAPEIPEAKILADLTAKEAAIASIRPDETVYLWFDCCMYDALLLARIFDRLNRLPAPPEVYLSCAEPVDFHHTRRLTPGAVRLGAAMWQAITSGKEAIDALLAAVDFSELPNLREGLERYREDIPDADGWTRTLRQLQALQDRGITGFDAIFQAQATYEKHPFMGDSHCRLLLLRLRELR